MDQLILGAKIINVNLKPIILINIEIKFGFEYGKNRLSI